MHCAELGYRIGGSRGDQSYWMILPNAVVIDVPVFDIFSLSYSSFQLRSHESSLTIVRFREATTNVRVRYLKLDVVKTEPDLQDDLRITQHAGNE